ncbi:MAG: LemA family protein [Parcubacteria group bacterium]|nr:LemA family protein [Parcubacteria group bacterium]
MYVVGSYNGLVSSNEQVDAQWAQVETAYQRRADLIPNVVSTVKGYAGHENQTLVAVTEARAKVGQMKIDASQLTPANLQKLQAFEKAQGELSSALSRLMVVVEKYPDLKASSLFQDLAVQLEGTENRITVERKRYNDSARTQNVKIKSFPTSIIANAFGFEEKIYFKAEEGSQKAPKVDFGVTK